MNEERNTCLARLAFAAALIAVMASPVPAQDGSGSSTPAFESFRIILDRNIFDPNRRQERPKSSRPQPTSTPARTEQISLIGTILYEQGSFAFFEGTEPEYDAIVKLGERIAGYRVAEIHSANVILEKDKQRMELRVGLGLSRQGEEEWAIALIERDADREAEAGSSSDGDDSSDQPANDVLKRLMERRRQEK